jgi:hypothetical protein
MNTEVSIQELQKAVENMHACSASWIKAVAVTESFKGAPVWEGGIQVFALSGHPSASRCYAWSSPVEGSDKRRFFAVLHQPPVSSALDAVRAAIVEEYRRAKKTD